MPFKMPTFRSWVAAGVLCALALPLQAQVHRCKGPDGKVIYSDHACAANATGGQVKLQNNSIDTSMDWERSERYVQKRRLENQAEATQRMPAPQLPVGGGATDSYACRQAIRNAGTYGSRTKPQEIDDARAAAARVCGYNPWPGTSMVQADAENRRIDAENRRSRALEAAARARMNPTLTNCDGGGCWDTMGNRYNGSKGTYYRSDGAYCTVNGNMMHCN